MEKEKYSSDSPVHARSDDRFSRWAFAERIARVISERRDPGSITIGLYGPWGDGKTSILNFIEAAAKENDSVIVVRFNPWLFGNVESLLPGFFEVLAEALDTKLITKGEKLGGFISKSAPGIASTVGMDGLGNAVGAFLHGPDMMKLRNRIEKALEKAKKRVLVMIDDMDRLEKAEIQVIFKLVRLVADFDHTAYILAFDKDIVAASLSENYSGARGRPGEQFLEKIIQVPLHLPAIPVRELRSFCFQGVDEALRIAEIELSDQQAQSFVGNFTRAFEGDLTTPRKARLYGNILMFSLPILKGEVNPVNLMLLEGMRVFVPELYETVRKNKDTFVGAFYHSIHSDSEPEKARIKKMIDSALKRAGAKDSSGYIELLKNLFPKIHAVYGNMHYRDDWGQKWYEGQRICAEGYFDRYFGYAVPKGDFSDTKLNTLIVDIGDAEALTPENNPLAAAITPENAESLIHKLRIKAKSLNAAQSASLSLAVSLAADKYPNPEGMFLGSTPHQQAAILVSNLIQNMDKSRRVSQAIECIRCSPEPGFQLDVFKFLEKGEKDKPEKDAFTEEEVNIIGKELAGCLEAFIQATDDITTDATRIAWYISYILDEYSRKHVFERHIREVLKRDKSAIIRLIDVYTRNSTVWGGESGVPVPPDFEQDEYNRLTRIFEPEFILSTIESYLGDLPTDQEDFPQAHEHNDRSILLGQFVWLHRRASPKQRDEETE
uniref:KAP family P-loop domain-containing protein n=1 Tax=Candidatus Kentrum sp. LFY TaxID=2126342 RepID=A0A450UGX6_9GAMM|nr:MAG: KAP family P-loop domain-containing protein [Candidatus Kentron sp. LFY]